MATTGNFDGRLLRINIDGNTVACAKECSLSIEQDLPDSSCKDDAGWNTQINGQKSWSLSVSALMDFGSTVGITDLGTALINGTLVTVLFTTGVAADTEWTGSADISSLQITASNGGVAEYTGEITGTGALTQQTAS